MATILTPDEIKQKIQDWITRLGGHEITGAHLNAILSAIMDYVGVGFAFKDSAPAEAPSSDVPVVYIAGPGTYTGYENDAVEVPQGSMCIFKYDGSDWSKSVLKIHEPVSVSQNTETGKEELLIGGTPALIVDNVPETGSDNLVKSGGVKAYSEKYPSFKLELDGFGNTSNPTYYVFNPKKNAKYYLRLSKKDWNTSSITDSSIVFCYGYINNSDVKTFVLSYLKNQQSDIGDIIEINTGFYPNAESFFIGFRGDNGEVVDVLIEEVIDNVFHKSISVTQGSEMSVSATKINSPKSIKEDTTVLVIVKTDCLKQVTIGYLIKGQNSATPAIVNTDVFNKILSFVIPANTEITNFALYATASDVIATGPVEYAVVVENGESAFIKNLSDRISPLEKDDKVFKRTITTTASTEINSSTSRLDVSIPANEIFSILVIDTNRCIASAVDSVLFYQITFEDDTYISSQKFVPNSIIYRQETKKIKQIYLWAASSAVIGSGQITLRVATCKSMLSIDYTSIIREKLKDFSILGDSWSTYYKWIPSGNSSWYAFDGVDGHNANAEEQNLNDVNSVKQTWWWLLSNLSAIKLLVDESYSGSCIAEWSYSGTPDQNYSFIPRMKKSIGEERTCEPKPDLVIIEGGTNDMNASAVIGDVQYSDWTDIDLQETIPAFCYIIDYLQKWNPGAMIVNIVNPNITEEIKAKMKTVCDHYGVYDFEMVGIARQNGHPSQDGMLMIKNQVVGYLNSVLSGSIFDV